MRIGALFQLTTAANYRVVHPIEALQRRGHDVVLPDASGNVELRHLAACDVVVVYQHCDAQMRQTIGTLKRNGVAVVWDNDLHIAAMPKSRAIKRSSGGMSNERIFAEMVRTARLAHATTTPTDVLAEVFRRAGVAPVHVVPNMLKDNLVRRRNAHEQLTIGWIAGTEHRADAAGVGLTDVLRRLQAKHPALAVTTVGVELGLKERYAHAPVVPFDQLPRVMADFDIGIAPLLDTPFNRARSDIKVKEYAASQVPWLASDCGPYAPLGERNGGRLVADDGWFDALDDLIADAAARELLARSGQQWALTQSADAVAAAYEHLLSDVVEQATGTRPATLVRSAVGVSIHDRPAESGRFAIKIPQRLVGQRRP
jgi:hypothetical protein